LEEVIGIDEASGYISLVGQRIGDWINHLYRQELGVAQLNPEQIAAVLVDLKKRILGEFYLVSLDAEKIVLGNRSCPFADKVIGRPSLCMMTSNVFGVITAENLGYARVVLEETIAAGHAGCKVIVYLKPSAGSEQGEGREYFKALAG